MAGLYNGVWSPAVKQLVHNAVVAHIDASDPTPGYITIHSAADAVLATMPLNIPCGTVNGTTGQLSFTIPSAVNGSADGTASYGTLWSGAGVQLISLPCASGTSAVSGYMVLSSLSMLTGRQVELVSLTIG